MHPQHSPRRPDRPQEGPSTEDSVGHEEASRKLWADPAGTGVRQWSPWKIPQENVRGNHPRMQHRDFCGTQEEARGTRRVQGVEGEASVVGTGDPVPTPPGRTQIRRTETH